MVMEEELYMDQHKGFVVSRKEDKAKESLYSLTSTKAIFDNFNF